ncbi:MAG: glucose-1-phosphate cytidylyltransferase [Candidatus Micrarchaeota archaeon]|nr:glucose-1-phosphate cytidylyltransferase [Candidatus Micrarchaeota archaeon]
MKVVILAGGYGTRLSEETANIPKPLVEIAGKPLIWYILKAYASQGFNDFIIACGYKGDKLKNYFMSLAHSSNDFTIDVSKNRTEVLNSKVPDWKVTLIDTGLNTMTGGRIKRLKKYIDGDTFMLTYGDGVSDVDLKALLRFHKAHGRKATLTAVRMPRFGILNIEGKGKVTSFQEKRLDQSPFINGGFMVLSKSVIDYIDDDKTSFETYPLQKLAEEGELYAFKHEGFWKAVDNIRDKQELEKIMESDDPRVKLWKD